MGSGKNILIIDDDSRNIFALKAVLRAKGYSCLSATSAEEGIDILKKQQDVGVVLLDMMMPEMDGYEAIPVIRKQQKQERIPVVAVTAQAMVGDREKCLDAGADYYLAKPIDVDALLEVLERYIR